MHETKISIQEVKNLIDDVISETLTNEMEFNQQYIANSILDDQSLIEKLKKLIADARAGSSDAVSNLKDEYEKLVTYINNIQPYSAERDALYAKFDELLADAHYLIYGGELGRSPMRENSLNDRRLSLKQAILKEKAPPGYTEDAMHKIKTGLRNAHPNWSEKKVTAVAFATAWKQHHKKNVSEAEGFYSKYFKRPNLDKAKENPDAAANKEIERRKQAAIASRAFRPPESKKTKPSSPEKIETPDARLTRLIEREKKLSDRIKELNQELAVYNYEKIKRLSADKKREHFKNNPSVQFIIDDLVSELKSKQSELESIRNLIHKHVYG